MNCPIHSRSPSPDDIFSFSPETKKFLSPQRQNASSAQSNVRTARMPASVRGNSANDLNGRTYLSPMESRDGPPIGAPIALGSTPNASRSDAICHILGLAVLGAAKDWFPKTSVIKSENAVIKYWVPHIPVEIPGALKEFFDELERRKNRVSFVNEEPGLDWESVHALQKEGMNRDQMRDLGQLFAYVKDGIDYLAEKATHRELKEYLERVKKVNQEGFKKHINLSLPAKEDCEVETHVLAEEAKGLKTDVHAPVDTAEMIILNAWDQLLDKIHDSDDMGLFTAYKNMVQDHYRNWTIANLCATVLELKRVKDSNPFALERLMQLISLSRY